jgi:hypothetical protein
MPSATHQNFVLLFRNHPDLGIELARRAGVPLLDGFARLEEVAAEFDDPLLTGNTVRADLALAGYEARTLAADPNKPRQALVIEVQLGQEADKEWTIVLYRAGLRRKLKCSAWTIVFSPDAKVRAGVNERMFLEEPELRPQVVTPQMIPIIRDLDEAIANYPWAVLAVTMHPVGPHAVDCARVAIQALLCVAPEDYGRYIQLVAASVGEDVMQQVREQLPPDDREELSEWERRGSMFTRGHAEGLEQGLEQGLTGLRAALRTVLEVRGLPIDDRTQTQIAACSDIDSLRELIGRAATITATDGLFLA